MTLDEFYDEFKQSLNLAAAVPLDTVKALGESFGVPIQQGEMHLDYVQRLASHLETLKVKK